MQGNRQRYLNGLMNMTNKSNYKKQNSGFTLIEMIVTVSIVSILASIAAPNFRTMLENNRTTAGTNEFVSALLLARSEALKRRNNISICTSIDQTTCAGNGTTDYSQGWIVFQDCDGNGEKDINVDCDNDGLLNDNEVVLKAQLALKQLNIVKTGGVVGNEDFFSYTFAGRSAANSFNVSRKGTTSPILKQIRVDRTGRVRTCTGVCP